ncbi:hypothetical protein ACNQVK_01135 [Mycobacterium sp. 134]|uniref:hypothetical protein n=1 Tax=Mycobacterium sp. 134 TaxID=3400425 RepID=UPI003AAE92C8
MALDNEYPDTYGTWLVIPYFTGDKGLPNSQRPLANVTPPAGQPAPIYWLCNGIRVEGNPLRKYIPDQPTTIEVDVANYGGGTNVAAITVTLWWAPPSPGFPPKLTPFGQAIVKARSRGGHTTAKITGTIPDGAGPNGHVCLLAQATAVGDQVTGNPAPGAERHWAQLNIDSINAEADGKFATMFIASNSSHQPKTYHLSAQITDTRSAEHLAELLDTQIARDPAITFELASGDTKSSDDRPLVLHLEPHQSVEVLLQGQTHQQADEVTIIEISQHGAAGPSHDIQGALAIAITR